MNTCKTCSYHQERSELRDNGAYCLCPSLHEEHDDGVDERTHLIYSYYEGGRFWTGDDFGCVNHKEVTI